MNHFNIGLDHIWKLDNTISRSISPENFNGEKGRGGMAKVGEGSASYAAERLGQGWKVNPYIIIPSQETFTIADIDGPGIIQHIWLTPTGKWRDTILRIYWDGQDNPSVECPIGDFFGVGWEEFFQISSSTVCVNPGSAFNCYWPMPFRKHCRMTLENRAEKGVAIYYQIDYALTEIPKESAYFHAQFRRVNPLPYKEVYTVLDGVQGQGKYVGTFMAWGVNNNGWWGEGEIKFYLDGDREFPTICGTGTEDYFCGSYDFADPFTNAGYLSFSTPYSGFYEVSQDKLYRSQKRFGMYRWHLMDPICFQNEIQVTIQALGWRADGRYLPLQDDLASVPYWYQTLPTAPFPELPPQEYLEII